MSVEESQNAIMKDFEMRFMPTLPLNSPSWRPVEQDPIDFNKWQWDNYPKLGLGPLDSPSRLKQRLKITNDDENISKVDEESSEKRMDH